METKQIIEQIVRLSSRQIQDILDEANRDIAEVKRKRDLYRLLGTSATNSDPHDVVEFWFQMAFDLDDEVEVKETALQLLTNRLRQFKKMPRASSAANLQ